MQEFIGEVATNYDRNILKLIPGYDLVHQLTAAYLQAFAGDNAKILLVGAGTCKELEVLANLNSTWRFYAQDISQDMLDIAKSKLNEGILSRTEFFNAPLADLPNLNCDFALSLFVVHFVQELNAKANFIGEIGKRLANNGTLLMADLMQSKIAEAQNFLGREYKLMGMGDNGITRSLKNQRENFYPITEKTLFELANKKDFVLMDKYFQAVEFAGYIFKKNIS